MAAERSDELPRRFLLAFLLLSLQRGGTSYGYELYEMVSSLGVSADLAAVYRSLRTMQQRELVASHWVSSDSGPDRRLYSLTGAGQSAAAAAAAELTAARDRLSAALEFFGTSAGNGAAGTVAVRGASARNASARNASTRPVDASGSADSVSHGSLPAGSVR